MLRNNSGYWFVALMATLLLSLALAACGTTQAAKPASNVAAGEVLFVQYCNTCHPNGGSKAGVAPSIKGKTPEVIKKRVRSGGQSFSMPAFGPDKISEVQLDSLIAYLGSLK